ncbi:glycogen-binding domain-containing protein [Algibacter mikhailovii]|uniref:glycogen-binding domain-containing protein n=1 Tax=Algibacter mikhailovii TaxID=425498 RepID=UPI002494F8B2|nr:glycogen-binding domain-containing protein [Algibacter mikhailovii]
MISRTLLYILILVSCNVYSQNNTTKGYRIEGDTLIFTFDARDYSKFTEEKTGKKFDFGDFDINSVIVSGEFNLWSRDHWKMKQIDTYNYELRKSIHDFTDEFSWEFKFIVNESFWAEPSKKDQNISIATNHGQSIRGVYNLKMYTAYPDAKGNASFKLNGYKNAQKVILAGSFNKWNEHLFEMHRTDSGWELILQMKPDVYQYRFIVDGEWMEDPDNQNRITNEFGAYNSVLDIKAYTTFKLRGYMDAKNVILAGSFNNWDEHAYEMRKMDYGWKYVIPLSGGKYHYKFIVDGQWIEDPHNSVKEYDQDGHINSVIMVK